MFNFNLSVKIYRSIELVYLEIFRSIWNYYDSNTYNRMCSYFINCKYPLLEMYRSFVKVNHSVLESIHQKPEDIYWGATLEECELMTLNFLNYHLPIETIKKKYNESTANNK